MNAVVVVPLLAAPDSTEGRAFALPIAGECNGYGKLDPITKSAALPVFAKALLARGTFAGGKRPKAIKGLLEDLFALAGPTLDGQKVQIAYILRGVYDALVAIGSRDSEISVRLRGKKDGASLFGVAFAEKEAAIAAALYGDAPEVAQKEIRLALTALTRSNLGHRPIRIAEEADRLQYEDDHIEEFIRRARERFAGVEELQNAISAYAAEMLGEAEEAPIAPVLRARLTEGALGFRASGEHFERMEGSDRLILEVAEIADRVHIHAELVGTDGRRSRERVESEPSTRPNAEEAVDTILRRIEPLLARTVEQRRILMGQEVDVEHLLTLVVNSRLFTNELLESTSVNPRTLGELALRMKALPYTEDIRLAWIKILGRPDCPRDVAVALETHTSKSVRDAVGARLARD